MHVEEFLKNIKEFIVDKYKIFNRLTKIIKTLHDKIHIYIYVNTILKY